MPDLIKLASQMREASAAGLPFKMPLMRFRDLAVLFELMGDD